MGNRAGEATTLNNMAEVYHYDGAARRALEFYGQALPIGARSGTGREGGHAEQHGGGAAVATGQPGAGVVRAGATAPAGGRGPGRRGGHAAQHGGVYQTVGATQRALE